MLDKLKSLFGGKSDDKQASGSDEKYCEKCGMNVPADHTHDEETTPESSEAQAEESTVSEEDDDAEAETCQTCGDVSTPDHPEH